MSLLDRGRDTIVVYPEVLSEDDLGNPVRVPSQRGIALHGRMQPASGTDGPDQTVVNAYVFRARDFPAGTFARVTWDGRDWDVDGEPLRHNGSDFTRHATVRLIARSQAPRA